MALATVLTGHVQKPEAIPVKPKFHIVAASLFKNGYAVVTRALDLRPGTTTLTEIPSGALGTVWFRVTEGLKITSVKNTFAPTSSANQRPPGNLAELIQLNLGKTVKLGLEKGSVSGKLVSISGDSLILKTAEGIKAIHPGAVTSIAGPGDLKTTTVDVNRSKKRVLKITVQGSGPGRVYMSALEKGLSWSPAYNLDITDPANLKFTMKATLIDDLGPMQGIETRLVTGFPNLLYAGTEDPIFAQTSLDEYLASIGASDARRNAMRADLALANGPMGQAAGRGGFGGGSFASANLLRDVSPTSPQSVSDNLGGLQAEDLYFYRLSDVQMDLGDRAYFVLATGQVPFKDIYTWEGRDPVINNISFGNNQNGQAPPPDAATEEVWHALEFTNSLGLPLTTAPAITVQGGEILGQDLLKYTAQGAKTTVKITKALDVEADSYDEELSRQRDALKLYNGLQLDLVQLKTTMTVLNHKTKTVHLKITFPYTGEVTDNGGGEEVKSRKSLHNVNPTGKLTWTKDLEPGATLTLSYKTKVYVNPRGF